MSECNSDVCVYMYVYEYVYVWYVYVYVYVYMSYLCAHALTTSSAGADYSEWRWTMIGKKMNNDW